MFRVIAALLAGLLLCAQTPMLPGFPPGTFQNRAALDAAGGGGGGTPAFNWMNYQNNTLGSNATTVNVGSTLQNTTCGTITSGDTLVAGVYRLNQTTGAVTPPAGWTQIGTDQNDGNGIVSYFYKIAGVGETCSYTFTWGVATFSAWVLYDFNGTNATTPVSQSITAGVNSGGGTTITTAGITDSNAPTILVLIVFSQATTQLLTAPADMTSRASVNQAATNMLLLASDAQKAGTLSSFTEQASNAQTSKAFVYLLLTLKG